MKINNLKLETITMDLLVPLEPKKAVEGTNISTSINLKKRKNNYNDKRISVFNKLLEKEIDKLK